MNQSHIQSDDLLGYIYQTLDDAQRETLNAHLVNCPPCRTRLETEKNRQRQIKSELQSNLISVTPTDQMNFASLAPRLEARGYFSTLWPRLAVSLPVTLAFIGLLFSLTGLWRIIQAHLHSVPNQPIGALPTLACFFLILASVEQFDRSLSIRPRYAVMALIAFVLWLGTAFIGLLNLIVIRDLAIMTVITFGGNAKLAAPFSIIAIMVGVMIYIGVVIGGAEYHYKNIGQPNSWKLFSVTLLAQLIILILPYLIL